MEPLSSNFFDRDTVIVARSLLGRRLVHNHPTGGRLVGRIVETEAYTENDPACHASHLSYDETGQVGAGGRGADLFAVPGLAYVYLIYGIHWLLNVVTEPEGTAGAVLIRAIEPEAGMDFMMSQRGDPSRAVNLTNGPGKLTEAFDLDGDSHRRTLTAPPLYLADADAVPDEAVATSSRIGISKGVRRQWRWYVEGNRFVSNGTPSGN